MTRVDLEVELAAALDAMEEVLNYLEPSEGKPSISSAVEVLYNALGIEDDPDE